MRNMDEKTAYEIKWLAELGIVMRCSYAERMSGGALTLAVLSLICAAFGIGGTDLEEVWPVAIVLLEMWLYLKIFMQERARKRSVHRMMEFFNEYKANKSQNEIDDQSKWEDFEI